jgi:DNA invertase Pin-like site-specific DNA recombinase
LTGLPRSLPDARAILAELAARQVKLNLGGSVHDPTDPVGRLLFNVLAMVAEFSVISTRRVADLIRPRTWEGMKVTKAKGRLRGKQTGRRQGGRPNRWANAETGPEPGKVGAADV